HTGAFAAVIALSRFGWREIDLLALVPRVANILRPVESFASSGAMTQWNDLHLASLRRGFRAHIARRGVLGQVNFFHTQVGEVVRHRYLTAADLERRIHSAIADYLLALPRNDILRECETMFHLIGADDRTRAARFYADRATPFDMVSEVTRTVAHHILKSDETESGLTWVLSLLENNSLDRDDILRLCTHFQEGLNEALEKVAPLDLRSRFLESVRTVLERLAAQDPNNLPVLGILSESDDRIGDVLLLQANLSEALKTYRRALAARQKLVAADPSNGVWQSLLSISHLNVGDVLRGEGDLSWALAAYRSALAGAEQAVVSGQDDVLSRMQLFKCQSRIGDMLLLLRKLPESQLSYRNALETSKFLKQYPGGDERLLLCHRQLGDVLLAQGDVAGALNEYLASLAIGRSLASADPSDQGHQQELAACYGKVGIALQAKNDFIAALEQARLCLRICENLVATDPTNAAWQRNLYRSYCLVAQCAEATGGCSPAEYWQRARKVTADMKRRGMSIPREMEANNIWIATRISEMPVSVRFLKNFYRILFSILKPFKGT
ncbi:MAG TPA: tetratricopeptide repeat protein, partial [Terriglobales bacterium]|nr:tetratricopeptide repeat protein [Terriglobales bacterium]